MKYCRYCNESFSDDDLFCPDCGSLLIRKENKSTTNSNNYVSSSGSIQRRSSSNQNIDSKIGIYKLVNDRTGEVFVTKSKNIEKAYERHMAALRNHSHQNEDLQEDYDNGDTFSLVILELFPYYDLHELNRATIEWVTREDSYNHGYNHYYGGGWNPYENDKYHTHGGRLR